MSEVSVATQIKGLEFQRDQAKALIEQRQMAQKLCENREFRKLIVDGFCRDEAARFVRLSVDTSISVEDRQDALGMAQASGYLKRFIDALVQMGEHAERTLPELDEALAEARAEEGAE